MRSSIIKVSKDNGVRRFIASSSSVYGIKSEKDVTEDHLSSLTDYSKYKALCEEVHRGRGPASRCSPSALHGVRILPATAARPDGQHLTNHAINEGVIKVFGAADAPNFHIDDMVRFLWRRSRGRQKR